jgi:hypothetical protein
MTGAPELYARTVRVATGLDAGLRARMLALYDSTYEGCTPESFFRDLDRKDDVILLFDRSDTLRGFSTLMRLDLEVDGALHHGVYSGDTVLEPGFRGTGALGRAFLRYMFARRLHHPVRPLWWFLISKGYKTYLLMANNFAEHWPRYEQSIPPDRDRLRAAFARALFGEAFDPKAGVVRFDPPGARLRADAAPIEPSLLAIPRVRYFQEQNPGWTRGDELVCVANMSWLLPFQYAWKKLHKPVSMP